MLEDAAIQSSTQKRHWTFTPDSLAAKRRRTNESAIVQIRQAQATAHRQDGRTTRDAERAEKAADDPLGVPMINEPQYLTYEEELALVNYYSVDAMGMCDHLELPTNVKATAVQFLRRFYLENSVMVHRPKMLVKTVVFLATKTENHYTPLATFASKIKGSTTEAVIEHEFLVTQGLRFMFDVRHPHRALEGGIMELIGMVEGKIQARPGDDGRAMRKVQQRLMSAAQSPDVAAVKNRIYTAHTEAKEVLKTAALMTDAYFLFLPSQIWFAALWMADEALAGFLIEIKLPDAESRGAAREMIEGCVRVMRSAPYGRDLKPSTDQRAQLSLLHKKLKMLQQSITPQAAEESEALKKRHVVADGDPAAPSPKKAKTAEG